MATVDAPRAAGDSDELAGFGYKQELDPGKLLVVRRGLQLHLDPHRRL
jgi:hypothetical protein